MLRIGKLAVRGQEVGHPSDLAPAHGVGLSGEAEGPSARLADLAGGQMQVDERRVLCRAARGLVQPLAIERERRRRLCEKPGGLDDVDLRDAAGGRGSPGRELAYRLAHRLETLRVAADVALVGPPFPQDD